MRRTAARECLDQLLAFGIRAWDELGALDARRGLADVFDADQRRAFARISKTGAGDLGTLGERIDEKLGRHPVKTMSTVFLVVPRLLWGVARAVDTDVQGALDAVRSMPGEESS